MGTRNLTMVIHNSKPVVAQYGQWDGYPSGQGATALQFLLQCNLKKFREVVDRCRFIEISKRKQNELQNFLDKLGCSNGWMDMEQSRMYKEKYPYLSRDNGATILQLLYNDETNNKLWIHDSSEFAADSLFCEWAQVIDLDKETFEVYQGFNQTPLEKTDRFYYLQEQNKHYKERREDDQYYPVKLVKSYKLSELPDVNTFVDEIESLTKEEEEA